MSDKKEDDFITEINELRNTVFDECKRLIDKHYGEYNMEDKVVKMTATLNAIGTNILYLSTNSLTRQGKKEILEAAFQQIVQMIRAEGRNKD